MTFALDDGREVLVGPGDVCMIPAGHDAWVVGSEQCVILDHGDLSEFAKPPARTQGAAAVDARKLGEA